MRLLAYCADETSLRVTRDLSDDEIAPYAILSHTWGKDEEEVTLHEIDSASTFQKPGYTKIDFCGKQARRDGWQYFWVDTCCIDKTNSVELSKAITSMYRWYNQAQVCYVYLTDVSSRTAPSGQDWHSDFRQSRWFTRGWTLQELLAPRTVVFYSQEWDRLGTKDELKSLLHEITGIPITALEGQHLSQFPVIERMRWTHGRRTKEKEDQAYCLLGIFNVYMPLIYGEGDNAFWRLQKKLDAQSRPDREPISQHLRILVSDQHQRSVDEVEQYPVGGHVNNLRNLDQDELHGSTIDPFAFFATASKVLQFVGLAIKLIRKTVEYSCNGGTTQGYTLQHLFRQLSVLITDSSYFLGADDITPQSSGCVSAHDFAKEECLKIAREICTLLNGMILDASSTMWRSVRSALHLHVVRGNFQTLVPRYEEARAHLALASLVCLHEHSRLPHGKRHPQFHTMSQQIAQAERETRYKFLMTSNLDQLILMFGDQSRVSNTIRAEWDDAVRKDSLCLQSVASHIVEGRNHPGSKYQEFLEKLQQVTVAMNSEIDIKMRILKSLIFSKMNRRRNHVQRAHAETYSWLFKHKKDDHVWHDFVTWLCTDNAEHVYWISGKPGSGKTTLMRELDEFLILRMSAWNRAARNPPDEGAEWLKLQRDSKKNLRSLNDTNMVMEYPDQRKPGPEDDLKDNWSDVIGELENWTRSEKLIMASCYFWCAGSANEQSVQGLLQNLIHQLLLQRPDLIREVVPEQIWQSAATSDDVSLLWEDADLITTINNFIHQVRNDDRLLLLIDGLDECGSDDEERERLLNLISSFTVAKHVKACVASRPWNIFRDAFRESPQLRLEDLTRADIELYITDKLEQDRNFQRHSSLDNGLLDTLKEEIIHGARGVFLWVQLVIRDLIRVLRDGGRPADLLQELERTPRALDDYFQRMLESVNTAYQRDAAMILLAALCRMDHISDNGKWKDGPDLLLIHLHYLSETGVVTLSSTKDLDYTFNSSRIHLLELLDRRLTSRCMGLLEIDTFQQNPRQCKQDDLSIRESRAALIPEAYKPADKCRPDLFRIEFLHRTVRDFLDQQSSKQLLRKYAGEAFDAHWYRCNMLALDVATHHSAARTELSADALACFCRQITQAAPAEPTFRLYELVFDAVQDHAQYLDLYASQESLTGFAILAEATANWVSQRNTAMSLAIQLGWTAYVQSRVARPLIQKKQGRSLLEYALRPSYRGEALADPDIVLALLESRADPDLAAFGWTEIPTWAFYLQALQYPGMYDDRSSRTVVSSLLRYGCRLLVSKHQLLSISRELCRHPLTNIRFEPRRALGSSQEPWVTFRDAEEIILSRLVRLFPQLSNQNGDLPLFSALDVLRSLVIMNGDDKGQALFNENMLSTFEQYIRILPEKEYEEEPDSGSDVGAGSGSASRMLADRVDTSPLQTGESTLNDAVSARSDNKRQNSNSTPINSSPRSRRHKQRRQATVLHI